MLPSPPLKIRDILLFIGFSPAITERGASLSGNFLPAIFRFPNVFGKKLFCEGFSPLGYLVVYITIKKTEPYEKTVFIFPIVDFRIVDLE